MKKSKKLLIVSFLVVFMFASLLAWSPVFAEGYDPTNWSGNTSGASDMSSVVGKIIGFVQIIGSALAVIMLIVIGIKYMIGSAEEKAEYKKTLLPYVIGAILIFAASNIAGIVYDFIGDM